jgi:hypothetical protein
VSVTVEQTETRANGSAKVAPSSSSAIVQEVRISRRTVDAVLVGAGIVVTIVLAVAGSLLFWGHRFATDYVSDELSSQNIVFPSAEALEAEGRSDLVKFAGEQVTTGEEAEAYASYIAGHLEETAGGMTYSELGGPEREARAAVQEAKDRGASEEEIAALQAELDTITNQRNTLFKGETLRGLLLSTFAWSTVGNIAGIAAWVAWAAAGLMLVLVVLGFWHYRKSARA